MICSWKSFIDNIDRAGFSGFRSSPVNSTGVYDLLLRLTLFIFSRNMFNLVDSYP